MSPPRPKCRNAILGALTPDALAQEEREEQEGARPLEGQEEREREAAHAPEERPAPDAQEEPPL